MDPLTVLGLACNVIEVVNFGREILSLCMRVHRDGSPEPDLAHKAAYLQSLFTKLVGSFRAAQTPNQLSKDQYGLQNIASMLLKTTNQLNQLIEDIRGGGASSRRAAVVYTVKYLLRYRTKIQSLEKTMVGYQNMLDSGILAHLWYVKTYFHVQIHPNTGEALLARQMPCNRNRTSRSLIIVFGTSSSNMHKGIEMSPTSSLGRRNQSKNTSQRNPRKSEASWQPTSKI
jgi:hypothetical protein